jgi:hypothetical protein
MKNRTKTLTQKTLLAASVLALAAGANAQQPTSGHYPAGAEGIKGASLPPPGFYLRDYNFVYWADRNKDNGPANFDLIAYINAPRLIWMTDYKILGANYGMDLIVPFYYSDVSFNAGGNKVKDNTFGLLDIQFEPLLLAWHFKQFDVAAGYAFWAPSGETPKAASPSRLGKGFWSNMFTAGATWYPDAEKQYALSILNRYEIHTESRDVKITPGNTYTVDFGLSRTLCKNIDAGVSGYYQQQITDDSGPGLPANYNRGLHDRVVGVGPEISTFCPKLGMFISARYAYEFAAEDRPEGQAVVVTVTKRF